MCQISMWPEKPCSPMTEDTNCHDCHNGQSFPYEHGTVNPVTIHYMEVRIFVTYCQPPASRKYYSFPIQLPTQIGFHFVLEFFVFASCLYQLHQQPLLLVYQCHDIKERGFYLIKLCYRGLFDTNKQALLCFACLLQQF